MQQTFPKPIPKPLAPLVAGLLLAGLAPALAEDTPATWTDQQKEDFLLTAKVLGTQDLKVGVTGSQRATLELGGHVHDAHVQTIDVAKRKSKVGAQTEVNFRDSFKYNIAAYRLDRMLGLGMVPVSVLRQHKREKAAVTWWIDDVQMSERERVSQQMKPPKLGPWQEQLNRALVFDQLVYNTDWNMSNLLITDDWTMWLIDFTRAFRIYKRLREPEKLRKIDADLLARLRSLEPQTVREELKDVLTGPEISGILGRRDAIVELFDQRIAAHGSAAVLYGTRSRKQS
ncbi:MAG: hypothetical protein OES47_14800 [Acidobacteriota bacterium]|nr:hypothetical protein [Acidobacteriota bacterium]